jgi:hypothetical protein
MARRYGARYAMHSCAGCEGAFPGSVGLRWVSSMDRLLPRWYTSKEGLEGGALDEGW